MKGSSKSAATDVTRWRQKWSVPSFAEPSRRTFFKGVRSAMSQPSTKRKSNGPNEQRQRDRSDNRAPAQHIDRLQVESAAGIPDQMPDAAERVMNQGPRVPEEHELSDDAAEEPDRKSTRLNSSHVKISYAV